MVMEYNLKQSKLLLNPAKRENIMKNKHAIDTRIARICAFCKHWYDPTHQHIAPKNPMSGIWYFDKSAKALCLKYNITKQSNASCSKFEKRV